MNKFGILLLLGGAGYLLSKSAATDTAVENLEYDIKGVKLDMSNPLRPKLNVNLEVFNPSQVNIKFKSLSGSVKYNGTAIGSFLVKDDKTDITFRPNATTNITVPVRIDALSVLNQLLSLLKKGTTKQVDIEGILHAGVLQLPFTKTIPISKP